MGSLGLGASTDGRALMGNANNPSLTQKRIRRPARDGFRSRAGRRGGTCGAVSGRRAVALHALAGADLGDLAAVHAGDAVDVRVPEVAADARDDGDVPAPALRAVVEHVRAVLAALVAVRTVEVDALVEALLHPAADDAFDGRQVFGVVQTHVLDVAAFAEVEVAELAVLLFKGRDFFRDVHVEGVREVLGAVVLGVREHVVDPTLFAEARVLLRLRGAEALGRRPVDRVEVVVLGLEFGETLLEVLQDARGEFAALFEETFARPEVRGFIQRRDAERRRHVAHQVAHFRIRILRAFVEAALREGERIARALLVADDVVALLEEVADHLEALVQHRPELFAPVVRVLQLRQADDDGEVQGHRTDVAAPDRDGLTLFVLPEREERAAAHRRRDDAVALVDFRDAPALRRKRQIVRVHAFARGLRGVLEEALRGLVRRDLRFVVEVHELREDDGLVIRPVTFAAHFEHDAGDGREPLTLFGRIGVDLPLTERDRREGEVAAAAGNRVELQFERLEALFELAHDVVVRGLLRQFFRQAQSAVLRERRGFALEHIGKQHLVEFGQRKAAELLGGGDQRDVAHDLKRGEDRLRFAVLDVAHLEAVFEHPADVEEAAVDAAQDHVAEVMDVDVAALDEALFLLREVELLVEALRQVALDERALRRDQRAVVVRVFAVAQAQDVVRVLAELFKRLRVCRLVVAVFGVGFGDFLELEEGERGDHEFVKLRDAHFRAAREAVLHFLRDLVHRLGGNPLVATEGGLLDRGDDLLRVEVFGRIVFLDHYEHRAPLRLQGASARRTSGEIWAQPGPAPVRASAGAPSSAPKKFLKSIGWAPETAPAKHPKHGMPSALTFGISFFRHHNP